MGMVDRFIVWYLRRIRKRGRHAFFRAYECYTEGGVPSRSMGDLCERSGRFHKRHMDAIMDAVYAPLPKHRSTVSMSCSDSR